jgi:ubiquitin-like 1-activating enzyme E1 B
MTHLRLMIEMAGNIIPAIATTNAIVAGLCVLQARHVLQNRLDEARIVFISRRPEHAFIAEALKPPNPSCHVCQIVRGELKCDPATTTLEEVCPFQKYLTPV